MASLAKHSMGAAEKLADAIWWGEEVDWLLIHSYYLGVFTEALDGAMRPRPRWKDAPPGPNTYTVVS